MAIRRGRKILIPVRRVVQYRRKMEALTKDFLLDIIQRAIVFVRTSETATAPARRPLVAEAARTTRFPSRRQVVSRFTKSAAGLDVSDPDRWFPRRIPDFQEYKDQIISSAKTRAYADALVNLKAAAYKTVKTELAAKAGIPPVVLPQTLEKIQTKTIKIVTTDITDNLAKELRKRMTDSIKAGMNVDEVVHNLGMLNTNWRTIARTETMDVLNMGAYEQAKQEADEFGATTYKGWLSSGSANPRASHQTAGQVYGAGNEIPLSEPFIVNGIPMMYPHDPEAPAEEVINCGCTVYYIVK